MPVAGFLGPEDGDCARGRQRHGVDGRDDHRHRYGDRKLLVELARQAGDENAWQKHRAEHQRDGQIGPVISSIAWMVAVRTSTPVARIRSMFSSTTMASSTTMPIASTSPNSVK